MSDEPTVERLPVTPEMQRAYDAMLIKTFRADKRMVDVMRWLEPWGVDLQKHNLKTDAQLAHVLNTRTPMISKIRNGVIRMTPALVIAVHEQTNIPVSKIKEMSK